MQPDIFLTLPSRLLFSSQTFCRGAGFGFGPPETKSRSHSAAYCFGGPVSARLPEWRGGSFVTGEPLIKFPLHPWPAAGAQWDGGGGVKWQLTLDRSAVFDIEALLKFFLRFWPLSLGAWHRWARSHPPPRNEVEVERPTPVTSHHDKSTMMQFKVCSSLLCC